MSLASRPNGAPSTRSASGAKRRERKHDRTNEAVAVAVERSRRAGRRCPQGGKTIGVVEAKEAATSMKEAAAPTVESIKEAATPKVEAMATRAADKIEQLSTHSGTTRSPRALRALAVAAAPRGVAAACAPGAGIRASG